MLLLGFFYGLNMSKVIIEYIDNSSRSLTEIQEELQDSFIEARIHVRPDSNRPYDLILAALQEINEDSISTSVKYHHKVEDAVYSVYSEAQEILDVALKRLIKLQYKKLGRELTDEEYTKIHTQKHS